MTHLKQLGYAEHRKEGVVIEGWPVQFLPADDALGAEASREGRVFRSGYELFPECSVVTLSK